MTRTIGLEGGVSLNDARETVRSDDYGKWDTTVSRNDLQLCDGQILFAHETGEEQLSPTTWATGQLCTRLGIPAPYFRRCPPELQDVQGNHWLRYGEHKPDEKWLLRAKDANLRAILSERYSPLDNATLLDELRPLLPTHYRVDWFGLSDESLHLRVVDPHRLKEVLPDDALTVGIHLSNSEVGLRSVTVDALVYRLVCSNGLIRLVKGKSLMRQRHLHVSGIRFIGVLDEAIENALKESENFLDQMQAATKTPVPEIEEVLEKIAERWHLSDETQESVKGALKREPAGQQESLFGLVNAFTSAAQTLPDDQRYDLEVLAGNLAAHGVSAYAPSRKKRKGSAELTDELETPVTRETPESEQPTNSVVEPSIMELAREMFDAEIVGRVPHGNTNGRQP